MISHKYTPVKFTITKSRALTPCRSPQCRAFSTAVMDEKWFSPLFPIDGGVGRQWLQMAGALFEVHFIHLKFIEGNHLALCVVWAHMLECFADNLIPTSGSL